MKKCGHVGFISHIFKPVVAPTLFLLVMTVGLAYIFNKYNVDGTGGVSNAIGGGWLGIMFALVIICSTKLYKALYSSYKYECEYSREKE